MKKITHTLITCILLVLFAGGTKAQISGVFTVPGTYTSIGAAITDLNTQGVNGAVTVNIAAGYTETAVAGGYTLNAITGASATNQITFRKSGSGANPILYAYSGGTATPSSALQDGIWKFNGSDYITIDGIDLTDLNTANPATMEYGYGFFRASVTDGCQNNTVKNCVITLNRINNASSSAPAIEGSRGIEIVNATIAAHTTALTITNATGTNSNNKIYSNTIQNCNYGISMIGYAASTPFTNGDTGNDIGGSSVATGNSIINYGGGTSNAAAGIRTLAQYSLNIAYNTINNNNGSGVNHGEVLRGIYMNTAASANATINSNTITLQSAGTSQLMAGITNAAGSTAASNTISIINNVIANCNYTTATSAVFNAILNSGTPTNLNISGNLVNNINLNGTATHVFIETGSSGGPITVNSNSITNVVCQGTSGTLRIIKTTSPSGGLLVSNNLVDGLNWSNLTSTGGGEGFYSFTSATNVTLTANIFRNFATPTSGVYYGIREYGSSGNKVFQNNQIYNFTTTAGGVGGASFYGMTIYTGSITISGNSVYGLSSTGTTGGTSGGAFGIYVGGGTIATVTKNKVYNLNTNSTGGGVLGIQFNYATTNIAINNLISGLTTPNSTFGNFAVVGLYMGAGTTNQVYYNTVNLSGTSSAAPFGATALWDASGANLDLRNNIFVNNATPTGAGFAVAHYRTSNSLTTYSATSNNNLYYAGTPSANNLIYWDGTNVLPTLAAYKALMATRDQAAVTENVNFVSTVGSNAGFLNINTTIPTQIESGGLPVSGVTDDYAGTVRNASTPDIGAFEGNYVVVPACSGTPATALVLSSASVVCPSVTVNFAVSTSYTNAGISYQWLASTTSSSTGFSAVPNATTAVFTNTNVTATTWYEFQVTCANGGGVSTSAPTQVILGAPTLTSVASTTAFCSGMTVNLSLNPVPAGLSYQWVTSGTSASTGYTAIPGATLSTLSNTTGVIGNNWYENIVSCAANASYSTASIPVQVLEKATPTASASVASNTVCYNTAFNLTGASDIGTAFSWTGPASYTSNVQNPTGLTYTTGGSATYVLLASANGCTSTPANVTINSLGVYNGGVASITPTTICAGSTTTLQITAFAANVSGYGFTPSTGVALLPLTSASSTLVTNSVDDAPSALSAIGFTFNYNGVNYTQISVSPDGWVRFGTVGSDEYSNSVVSTSNLPKLYPYWDDLHTGTNGYVRTQLLGSAPNRTMVIEWFVTIPRSGSVPANSTFQAWLIEGSNNVQFVYGTMGSGSMSASTGLTGSSSNYNSVTISNNTNSTSSPNDNNNGQPATGTSYLFTPPVSPTYTWASANNLSATSGATVTSTPTIAAGSFTALANYSLNLTYQGCATTKTLVALVANNPTLTLSTTNTNVCSGTSATLTATGANTYTWNTSATTASIVVSPTVNTTYTVSASNGACATATQVITLNTSQSPTVTISGSSGICTGQNATLTANGANTYVWNSGSTATTIVDSPSITTVYTVTGTDAVGCKGVASQTVTVAAGLNISIAGPSVICIGQAANLTASGGVTYTWSTGATTNTIAPTPTTMTTYSVVGASGTCSNSASKTVSVNPNPTVTVSGSSSTVCAGTTVTLTAGGGNTYTWSTSSNASSVAVTPTTTTSYTVTGTNTVGCSVSTVIAINTNTVPVITIAQTSTLLCATSPLTLTASGANTFSWTSGPVNAVNVVNPTANTTYTVSGTNAAGCVSSKTASIAVNSLPVITITPSSPTLCATSSATLLASGTGSYSWSGGPATASYVVTPLNTVSYSVTGTNTTTGCSAVKVVTVVVNALPSLTIAPAVSQTVCSLAGATFTAAGATSYTWSGNASFFSNVAYYPTQSSTYTVTGKNAANCVSTATVAVTTLTLPVITLAPATSTVCPGSTTTFTADGANTYTWANNTSTASTAVYTITAPAAYTVSGSGPNGCSTSTSVLVFTYSLPTVAVAASDQTICALSPVTFTASGANTYSWNTAASGSVITVNPANSSVIYTVTGTNTLTGCVDTETASVMTNPLPTVVATPASTTICRNTSVGLTASGAVAYSWAHNGSVNTSVNVTPSVTTVYGVTGTDALGCSNTASATVTVNQLPVIAVSPASATICSNDGSATFTASGAASYIWITGTAASDTFVASPAVSTAYTVTGTDANNCVGKAIVGVLVDPCTGIKTTSFSGNVVSVYPNPSNGVFTAKFDFEGSKTVSITNSVGQLITQTTTTSTTESFDLSGMAKGVYFVKVSSKNASGNYKIVIE